jgi:hypothetical protein
MPSVTSWTRLEPDRRRDSTAASLAARVLDPLWLLTRQWQIGEFQGEDGGSPVFARMRAEVTMLSRCHLGELPADTIISAPRYDPRAQPLEVVAERGVARPTGPDDPGALRTALEAGRHLLRMLAQQPLDHDYAGAFVTRFPFSLPAGPGPNGRPVTDELTARQLRLAAGRAVDGRLVRAACEAHGSAAVAADPQLGVAPGDRAEVRDGLDAWLAWYGQAFSEPAAGTTGAWVTSRLEHQLSVAGRLSPDPFDEVTLTATQIDAGRLDWSTFDVDLQVRTGTDGEHGVPDDDTSVLVRTAVPAPVSVPGVPAHRFWEFESGALDYAQLPSQATDLAHLLLAEYASSYGNDWYLLPLTLPIGSLTRITSLVVTDSFGRRLLVRPVGDTALAPTDWAMWQQAYLHRAGSDSPSGCMRNLFFLPPALGQVFDGPATEDVLLLRDETVNVAWAIERLLETGWESGARALAVAEPAAEEGRAAGEQGRPDDGRNGPSRYLLTSDVPQDWVPLLPVEHEQDDGTLTVRLRRGAVLHEGSPQVQPARSLLLAEQADFEVHPEEVPREGKRVQRRRRMARWIDGSTHVWVAHDVEIGRGEARSGLSFDQLLPPS